MRGESTEFSGGGGGKVRLRWRSSSFSPSLIAMSFFLLLFTGAVGLRSANPTYGAYPAASGLAQTREATATTARGRWATESSSGKKKRLSN